MKKIIILDDNYAFLNMCVRAFIKAGVDEDNVLGTHETHRALVMLKEHAGDIIAFVCDYELDNYNFGDDVIKKVKKDFPDLRCILMSSGDAREKAEAVGVEFWYKALRAEPLVEFVGVKRSA